MSDLEPTEDDHLVAVVRCSVCDEGAARVEVVPPGRLPVRSSTWPRELLELFLSNRKPDAWRIIYNGVVAGNGNLGDDADAAEAAVYREAFRAPITYERVRHAALYDDAGFCSECEAAYCPSHWNLSGGSWGRCPNGHKKGHDPHWSPYDDD